MELLVFGDRGARVIVFPTRDGRFFDYENWGMVRALADKIREGYLQLICVDSNDRNSLYADWMAAPDRMKGHENYESYILEEVLPFTERQNPGSFVIAHGCSLGAYHAVNIAFRHPDQFGKVVALSGRYDLTVNVGTFRDLFDGHYDDQIYYNNPSYFVPRIEDPQLLDKLRRMEIILAIGEEDAFLQNNREFSGVLTDKAIPHALFVWGGEAHRPRYWRQMVRFYL
ncbi:MAG: esterase family protein [Cytophagales bacterium]|nr:esterase family protein [Armatimonadota bacterium]